MEALGDSLYLDTVPERWAKLAYPSLHGLSQWFGDLQHRIKELEVPTTRYQLNVALNRCHTDYDMYSRQSCII